MRWRLKSSASRLFAQPFVQAHIKENIKAPCHWPLWGRSTSQRASIAEIFPFDAVISSTGICQPRGYDVCQKGGGASRWSGCGASSKVTINLCHGAIITSLLHQNDVTTLFRRNIDVIIASCWDGIQVIFLCSLAFKWWIAKHHFE